MATTTANTSNISLSEPDIISLLMEEEKPVKKPSAQAPFFWLTVHPSLAPQRTVHRLLRLKHAHRMGLQNYSSSTTTSSTDIATGVGSGLAWRGEGPKIPNEVFRISW
jgi:hypothetical protein